MKTLYLEEINNPDKKKVLIYLQEHGKAVYEDIIKELNMSATKGQEIILSLVSHDMIKHIDKTSYLELNVDLR